MSAGASDTGRMNSNTPTGLITLFARQEPSTSVRGRLDTVFYRDRDCKDAKVRWGYGVSRRPTSCRFVTLNCYRWKLEWLPALTRVTA